MGGSTGSGSTTTPFASPSFNTNTITSNQSMPSAVGDAFAMQALNSNIGQPSSYSGQPDAGFGQFANAVSSLSAPSSSGAPKAGGTQSPSANGQINQGSTPTFGQPSSPTSFGQPSSPTLGSGTLSSSGGSTPPFGQPAAPMTPDPSGMTVNQTSSSPMVAGAPAQNGIAGTASTYQPPSSLPFNANSFLSSMGNFNSMLGQGNSYGNNNPFGSAASPTPFGSSGSGSNPSPLNSGSSKTGGTQSGSFGFGG